MITAEILNRKGARRMSEIPSNVLDLLNTGKIETVNLVEWLSVDYQTLVPTVLKELDLSFLIEPILQSVKKLPKITTTQIFKQIGQTIYDETKDSEDFISIKKALSHHPSDIIRNYACYLIGLDERLSLNEMLEQIKLFAQDTHFGVREIAWMAVRPSISVHLDDAITFLISWTDSSDENLRRFVTESTRPRGVWCTHIERLKKSPNLALPLLNPLKSDKSKYVQDSVANWLNDASKTAPEFVRNLCKQWYSESTSQETLKIIKKALRTLDKKPTAN